MTSAKSRESSWSKEETMELISLPSSTKWQETFSRGKTSHTVVWSELVKLLSRQCDGKGAKNKWDGIKREYRNIKNLKTGDACPTWPYWEVMKRYMEPRPMENNHLVIDSITLLNETSNDSTEFSSGETSTTSALHPPKNEIPTSNENEPPNRQTLRTQRKRKGEDFETSFKKFIEDQQVKAEENRQINNQMINLLGTLITCLQSQAATTTVLLQNPPQPQD